VFDATASAVSSRKRGPQAGEPDHLWRGPRDAGCATWRTIWKSRACRAVQGVQPLDL